MKKIRKWTIFIIFILLIVSFCSSTGDTDNKEEKKSEEKVVETITELEEVQIDEFFKEPSKYLDKEILLNAYVYNPVCGNDSCEYNRLNDKNYTNLLMMNLDNTKGQVKEIKEMDYVQVRGIAKSNDGSIILNASNIKILEPSNPNELRNNTFTRFSQRKKAYDNTDQNLNADTFFRNPSTYADGTEYLFIGTVKDISKSDLFSSGIITLQGGNDTIVSINFNGRMNVMEGDKILVIATIDSTTSSYTTTSLNGDKQFHDCPSITVNDYLYEEEILKSLDADENEFIYNHIYSNSNGRTFPDLGNSFELTENTIGGYSYKLQKISYTYGNDMFVNGDNGNLFAGFRIMLKLKVNFPSGVREILVFFSLDGTVGVDNVGDYNR